jgi:hypothetical protein
MRKTCLASEHRSLPPTRALPPRRQSVSNDWRDESATLALRRLRLDLQLKKGGDKPPLCRTINRSPGGGSAMLRALDPYCVHSKQPKTPWQAVSKNDNEAIECAPHGLAEAAFQDTLATLPIVTYEAGETVIADGSRDRAAVNSKERHSHDPRRRAPLRDVSPDVCFRR